MTDRTKAAEAVQGLSDDDLRRILADRQAAHASVAVAQLAQTVATCEVRTAERDEARGLLCVAGVELVESRAEVWRLRDHVESTERDLNIVNRKLRAALTASDDAYNAGWREGAGLPATEALDAKPTLEVTP
jgi:hypothetical protein